MNIRALSVDKANKAKSSSRIRADGNNAGTILGCLLLFRLFECVDGRRLKKGRKSIRRKQIKNWPKERSIDRSIRLLKL